MTDKPSNAAMRAAERICEKTGPEYGVRYDDDSIIEIARLIDEETGLKELIEVLEEAFKLINGLNVADGDPIGGYKIHPVRIRAYRAITKAKRET